MLNNLNFPSNPSFRAQWKAIYLEPILNSGERINILIIIKNENNSIEVFESLHPTIIDNLYGTKSSSFHKLILFIKNQIISNEGNINTSIDGIYESNWTDALSVDKKGIIRQALYKSASLGVVALQGLYESEGENNLNDQIDKRWANQIRNIFLERNPTYRNRNYFDIKLRIENNVKISCGFHTSHYSAKFNVCSSQTLARMKANLLDLQILDRHNISNQFDLILYLPSDDDIRMTPKALNSMKANIKILKEEVSSKNNIHVIECDSAEEGVFRMEKMLKVS